MDLKDTIWRWYEALVLTRDARFHEATDLLLSIKSPSAKIFHCVACVKMMQASYEEAIQFFTTACERDQHLALSFFLRGLSYHQNGRFDQAEQDLRRCLSMTPCDGINYRPLGADFVLTPHKIEEYYALNQNASVKKTFQQLLDIPIRECLFWPPKKMVDNLVKRDFLGKAKMISSTAEKDIEYAAEKLKPQTSSGQFLSSSISTNSHVGQVIVTPQGRKVRVPPPPRRPVPSLPVNLRSHGQLSREKSRSAEDILDSPGRSEGLTNHLSLGANRFMNSGSSQNINQTTVSSGVPYVFNTTHSKSNSHINNHNSDTKKNSGHHSSSQDRLSPNRQPFHLQNVGCTSASRSRPITHSFSAATKKDSAEATEDQPWRSVKDLVSGFSNANITKPQNQSNLQPSAQPVSHSRVSSIPPNVSISSSSKPAKPPRPPPPKINR